MSFRKLIISGILGAAILFAGSGTGYTQNTTYQVQPGDTFWVISQKHEVPLDRLMQANNASSSTILYVGQTIVIPSLTSPENNTTIHTVQTGDTFWVISQKYGIDIQSLMAANNADQNTVLNIGDKIVIPSSQNTQETVHTVQSGETFWIISQKYSVNANDLMAYNGANQATVLYVGQKLKIPAQSFTSSPTPPPVQDSAGPYITYTNYTVQRGDDFWKISIKFGISVQELLKANNMNESSVLNIGDVLKIPVHHVPVKPTPGEKYGEYLDWWTEAQYVLPVQSVFEVVDFYTGKSFKAKRTTGANHADVEALTLEDTKIMKEIWGGSFTWARRPIVIKFNGRKLAASASAMPHAGNDNAPGGVYTTWRSDGYPAGYNFDWVKSNGMDGVFDVHFANSTRHSDGRVDEKHQENIKISAGLK